MLNINKIMNSFVFAQIFQGFELSGIYLLISNDFNDILDILVLSTVGIAWQ